MTVMIKYITQTEPDYPERLRQYLGADAPDAIWTLGNLNLLTNAGGALWALFCSSRCPGAVILKTHEFAQHLREAGVPTIGGYHSPVEKECLRILLRGSQPIILCPARGLEKMRLRGEWKQPFAEGRLLLLSVFDEKHRRPTIQLTSRRNVVVAALADKVLIAHASEGGKTLGFAQRVLGWGKPVFTFAVATNTHLIQVGVQPLTPALGKAAESPPSAMTPTPALATSVINDDNKILYKG